MVAGWPGARAGPSSIDTGYPNKLKFTSSARTAGETAKPVSGGHVTVAHPRQNASPSLLISRKCNATKGCCTEDVPTSEARGHVTSENYMFNAESFSFYCETDFIHVNTILGCPF